MYTRITGSSTVHIHTGIFQTDPVAVSQIMADTAIIFPGIFTHGITQNIVFIGPAINKIPVSIPPIISITQLQTHIPATVTAKQLREIHTDTAGMLTGEPAGLIFAIQRAVKQVYTANIVPLVVTLGIITQYPMLI